MSNISGFKMDPDSRKRIKELRNQLLIKPALKCADCGTNIHETITGKYDTDHGVLCKNCFAKRIGEEIERHPIGPAPLEKASH